MGSLFFIQYFSSLYNLTLKTVNISKIKFIGEIFNKNKVTTFQELWVEVNAVGRDGLRAEM